MRRFSSIVVVAAFVGAAVARPALTQVGPGGLPIRIGCPSKVERVGAVPATIDSVIAVARTVVARQVTHFQGRTERRNARNTPVSAVVMELGMSFRTSEVRRSELLREARAICGGTVARMSSAVLFADGLTPMAATLIPVFVVRTDDSWRVFPRLQP